MARILVYLKQKSKNLWIFKIHRKMVPLKCKKCSFPCSSAQFLHFSSQILYHRRSLIYTSYTHHIYIIYSSTYTCTCTNTYTNTYTNIIDYKGGATEGRPSFIIYIIGTCIGICIGTCTGVCIGIYDVYMVCIRCIYDVYMMCI